MFTLLPASSSPSAASAPSLFITPSSETAMPNESKTTSNALPISQTTSEVTTALPDSTQDKISPASEPEATAIQRGEALTESFRKALTDSIQEALTRENRDTPPPSLALIGAFQGAAIVIQKKLQEQLAKGEVTLKGEGYSSVYTMLNLSDTPLISEDKKSYHPRVLAWQNASVPHSHPDGNCVFHVATEGAKEELYKSTGEGNKATKIETKSLDAGFCGFDPGRDSGYIHRFVPRETPIDGLKVISPEPGATEPLPVRAVTVNLYEGAMPGKPAGSIPFEEDKTYQSFQARISEQKRSAGEQRSAGRRL